MKAVVVRKPGADVTAEALMALVRERKGPVYAPKSVDFADTLPLTAVGKADKKALRAPYWGGPGAARALGAGRRLTSHWSRRPPAYAALRLSGAAHRGR